MTVARMTSLTRAVFGSMMLCFLFASPARAQECTYHGLHEWEGYAYLMRSDGVLVRFGMIDQSVLEYPSTAPPGRYVAMFRNPHNPLLSGLMAVREDGLIAYLPWGSLNNQWQVLATLPSCIPVPAAGTTLGAVKALYKGNQTKP